MYVIYTRNFHSFISARVVFSSKHLVAGLPLITDNHADKPQIEELHQFLEFQLPRQWAPEYGDLPLGPRRKKQASPALQFTFMGPKLYINTDKVCFVYT